MQFFLVFAPKNPLFWLSPWSSTFYIYKIYQYSAGSFQNQSHFYQVTSPDYMPMPYISPSYYPPQYNHVMGQGTYFEHVFNPASNIESNPIQTHSSGQAKEQGEDVMGQGSNFEHDFTPASNMESTPIQTHNSEQTKEQGEGRVNNDSVKKLKSREKQRARRKATKQPQQNKHEDKKTESLNHPGNQGVQESQQD